MVNAIAIQLSNSIANAPGRIAGGRLTLPSGSNSLAMYDWMREWPARDLRYGPSSSLQYESKDVLIVAL